MTPQEVIENYFQATYHADTKALQQVFHKEARVMGLLNNELQNWSANDFINIVCARPSAASNNEKFDKTITTSETNGNIAYVQTCNRVGDTVFVDQMNLIKNKKGWKLLSKVFAPEK